VYNQSNFRPKEVTMGKIDWTRVILGVLVGGSFLTAPSQSPDAAVIKHLADTKFATVTNTPGCPAAAVQHGDPNKGASVWLFKASPGCTYPWHWHTPNEQLMMVSGTSEVHMRGEKPVLLHSGAFVFIPSHHIHLFRCKTSCLLYLYSEAPFDIHYVDEAGKEIPPESALKAPSTAAGTAPKR